MIRAMRLLPAGVGVLALSLGVASARAQSLAPYEQLTRDVLRELVEIPTTESGVGATPAARAIERRLLAAGFAREDVQSSARTSGS